MSKPKTYSEVSIDGVRYVPAVRRPLTTEAKQLLSDVYGVLWMESYYDPFNGETQKFAKGVVGKMQRLNELLGFKQ